MSGYDQLKARLTYAAGGEAPTQENINTQNKYLSFEASMTNSEQCEEVITLSGTWHTLINPDKLNESYDQKEMSIDHAAGIMPGDIINWPRTETNWLVLMRSLEEKAYMRARIRKCNYLITIDDEEYPICVTGPTVETLNMASKHGISYNKLNYDMMFYITKDTLTDAFFKRLQIIKFEGHNWRVEAVDRYTKEGVIEVYLGEYYDNSIKDAAEAEAEIVPPEVDTFAPYIEGPATVKPYDTNVEYVVKNMPSGYFVVNSSKVEIIKKEQFSIVLNITTGKSGSFEVTFRNQTNVVTFPVTIASL